MKKQSAWQHDAASVVVEEKATSPTKNMACELSGRSRSTFLITFSPNGQFIGSTHGDHTVRVTDVTSGKCLHVLKGHPRTPWSIAFHPTSNNLLASGCLAGHVRIWDLHGGGSEVWKTPKNTVVTSLTFHPSGQVLLVATSNNILFWDWSQSEPFAQCATRSSYEKVRWVRFDTLGHFLYTGISNTTSVQGEEAEETSMPESDAPMRRGDTHQLRDRYQTIVEQITSLQRDGALSGTMSDWRLMLRRQVNSQTDSQEGSQVDAPATTDVEPDGDDEFLRHSPENSQSLEDATNYASLVTLATRAAMITRQGATSDSPPVTRHGASASLGVAAITSDTRQVSSVTNQGRMTWTPAQVVGSTLGAMSTSATSGAMSTSAPLGAMSMSAPLGAMSTSATLGAMSTSTTLGAMSASTSLGATSTSATLGNTSTSTTLRPMSTSATLGAMSTSAAGALCNPSVASDTLVVPSQCNDPEASSANPRSVDTSDDPLQTDFPQCTVLSHPAGGGNTNEMPARTRRSSTLVLPPVLGNCAPSMTVESHFSPVRMSSSNSLSSDDATPPPSDERDEAASSEHHYHCTVLGESRHSLLFANVQARLAGLRPHGGSTNAEQTPAGMSGESSLSQNNSMRTRPRQVPVHRTVTTAGPSDGGSSSITTQSQSERGMTWRSRREPDRDDVEQDRSSTEWSRLHNLAVLASRESDAEEVEDGSGVFLVDHSRRWSGALQQRVWTMRRELARRRQERRETQRRWHVSPRHHLHPHYSMSVLDGGNRSNNGLQAAINRAIAGAFTARGEASVASNIDNLTHRIQRWDISSKFQMPNIDDSDINVVVSHCKMHNDTSCDISKDGTLLTTFVPSHQGFPDDTILGVFSLCPETLGQCMFTKSFGPNAISVSLSPLNNYVLVGLAARRLAWVFAQQMVGQVYRLKTAIAGEDSMQTSCDFQHVCDLMHPCDADMQSHVSVNTACWLPEVGQGIAYATNKGDLHICTPGHDDASEKTSAGSGSHEFNFGATEPHADAGSDRAPSHALLHAGTPTTDHWLPDRLFVRPLRLNVTLQHPQWTLLQTHVYTSHTIFDLVNIHALISEHPFY
ncbi:Activating molecule in BECN1-regulated autophagy protein 1 [Lamellibrachia satsuma]|nr:Activating molecule in BECN1-regulated autophagy protein 1 [Lamellibrachia satsuma]